MKKGKISKISPKLWSTGLHQRQDFSWHFRSLCSDHGCSFRVGAGPGEKREGSPAVPHTGSNRCPVQSSLHHSHPAHGAVLRLTAFRTKLRSRRETNQLTAVLVVGRVLTPCPSLLAAASCPECAVTRLLYLVSSSLLSSVGGWPAVNLLYLGGCRMMCSLF